MPENHTAQDPENFNLKRADIEVYGLVQDVNFRYIFQQHGKKLRLKGEIWNDQEDQNIVHITIEGDKPRIELFINHLSSYKNPPQSKGTMAQLPSLIEVDSFNVEWTDIKEPKYKNFMVNRKEFAEVDKDPIQIAILGKVSMDGALYQQFHRDHNKNFHTLEERYGSVSDGIKEAVQWLKFGILAGLGMGAILTYVLYGLG